MHDERGYYYLAQPGNPDIRVYVRNGPNGYEFKLWHRALPQVWDKHEWVDYDTICRAAALYQSEYNPDMDPRKIYDPEIARNLLSGISE